MRRSSMAVVKDPCTLVRDAPSIDSKKTLHRRMLDRDYVLRTSCRGRCKGGRSGGDRLGGWSEVATRRKPCELSPVEVKSGVSVSNDEGKDCMETVGGVERSKEGQQVEDRDGGDGFGGQVDGSNRRVRG
jgi:hypothetical protein